MSLYGMMRTSVSGMNAQASRLASVSDNVANSATIGYKQSSVEFRTQVLDVETSRYQPGSVRTETRYDISRQGPIVGTDSGTDLAIDGDGFFVVQGGDNDYFLTRAGSFIVNNEGQLENAQGNVLTGYQLNANTSLPVANGFGGLDPINIGQLELVAQGTDAATLVPNLPDNATAVAAGSRPSDNVATSESTGKTSLLMYDTLGNERVIDIYYTKTADDTWEATAFDASTSTNNGFPYSSAPLATQTITFDPITGYVTGGGSTAMTITVPGGIAATIDMTGISQLGTDYQVITAEANGSAPGSVESVEIDGTGTVYAIYKNGYSIPVYQIALASVPSTDSLKPVSGTAFTVTIDSGDVLVGNPQDNGNGSIISGALEESNVDLSTELTLMIQSQRSYTANSRVFQTGSELMDVLINI